MSEIKAEQDGAAPPAIGRRGMMLVLSSPSGAGKSTLAAMLLDADQGTALSVSVTTRLPRPGERDGAHYHFIDRERFDAMRRGGELLEWAEVFGNCYGTPRRPVEAELGAGRDVIFDIDWQGAQQLYRQVADDVVRVFILPPSRRVLAERLSRRAADPQEVIARRMAAAAGEIGHWGEYDYVIVNDDLETSLAGLRSILAAERLRRQRYVGLDRFVDQLLRQA